MTGFCCFVRTFSSFIESGEAAAMINTLTITLDVYYSCIQDLFANNKH